MGHIDCFSFGERQLNRDLIEQKDIVEVGASADGGSMRPYCLSLNPKSYIGVDIQEAPGVDLICDALDLLDKLGPESCDVVIATELMEHIRDWRKLIHVFKNLLREEGVVIITTRSLGFPFHYAPFDFWRYEVSDMEEIFRDFEIMCIEKDTRVINNKITPGVFISAKKPKTFIENNLDNLHLYSIIKKARVANINNIDIINFELFDLGKNYFFKHNFLPFIIRETLSKHIIRPWRNRKAKH
ncbi:class I SAM-dependent methyltransferase [Methylotuvimicrobium sp. KM1]|uniref:class I SAM-dependent methyltransferase n=1 Tax=Methylotuvimicrobium sp. KM1 TaxID=3377707 RepID=UPI0038508DBC